MDEAEKASAGGAAGVLLRDRVSPATMVLLAAFGAVFLGIAFSRGPDAGDLAALRRSTARVESRSVNCGNAGRGPNATISLDARCYACGGVECDRGGRASLTRWVRFDPNDPRRCRAEEGLGGATSWETQWTVIFGAFGLGSLAVSAAVAVALLRRRTAERAFDASQEWKDYASGRDGR
jgi:hypothetical protein